MNRELRRILAQREEMLREEAEYARWTLPYGIRMCNRSMGYRRRMKMKNWVIDHLSPARGL